MKTWHPQPEGLHHHFRPFTKAPPGHTDKKNTTISLTNAISPCSAARRRLHCSHSNSAWAASFRGGLAGAAWGEPAGVTQCERGRPDLWQRCTAPEGGFPPAAWCPSSGFPRPSWETRWRRQTVVQSFRTRRQASRRCSEAPAPPPTHTAPGTAREERDVTVTKRKSCPTCRAVRVRFY